MSEFEQLTLWRRKVRAVQSTRMDPVMVARLQEQSARLARAKQSLRECRYLERANYASSAANTISLQQQAAPAIYAKSGSAASATHSARSASLLSSLARRKTKRSSSEPTPAKNKTPVLAEFNLCSVVQESDSENDSDEEALERLEQDLLAENAIMCATVSAAPAAAPQQAAAARAQGDTEDDLFAGAVVPVRQEDLLSGGSLGAVDRLLSQLAVEPQDPEQLMAKFALFENMLSTVTTIREQTMEFWADNSDQFLGAAKIECQKRLKDIDNQDAMGIVDDDGRWFVFHMTSKANKNAKTIAGVLSVLRTKLELLLQDLGECPCCLDPLVVGEGTTTLGCCHKICTPCWTHWLQLKRDDVFCPLCRHEAFVEELFANDDEES